MTDQPAEGTESEAPNSDYDELWKNRAFDPEMIAKVKADMRKEDEERTKLLFGDNKPFPVPSTDVDY